MPLRRHLLAGAAFLATLPAPAHDAGAQAVKVRLGTATPGGGFPVYGAAFIAAVRRVDPGLEIEADQHQGQHRERADAGSRHARHRPGAGRGGARSRWAASAGRRRISGSSRRCIPTAGMFVVRADSPYRTHRRPQGQAGRLGRAGSGLVILGRYVHGRAGARCGEGFPADLSRARGRRAGDGARRPRRRAVGRRRRLAGLHDGVPRASRAARFIAPDADEIARILAKHHVPQADRRRRPAAFPARTPRSPRSARGAS